MNLNPTLVESLLHEEESHVLDFKQGQYRFKKVKSSELTEKNRGELVKDLVAFANTERTQSAFILIGVKEVKGGRSEVVGVAEHLVDDDLHDFMSRRTQRPVEFSYTPFEFQGFEIGVIEIPVQNRPVFLTTDYGGLCTNQVYIRTGGSTRTATPYEIQEMMAPKPPSFTVSWFDTIKNEFLHSSCSLDSLVLSPVLRKEAVPLEGSSSLDISFLSHRNPDYPQELIIHTVYKNLCKPLSLQIHNSSGVTGKRIRFEGSITKANSFMVVDRLPDCPKEYYDPISSIQVPEFYPSDEVTTTLLEDSEHWRISIEFGDIRPDERILTDDSLWFGSSSSCRVTMTGRILGENIPDPINCSLDIEFETQWRPMTIEDIDEAKVSGQ